MCMVCKINIDTEYILYWEHCANENDDELNLLYAYDNMTCKIKTMLMCLTQFILSTSLKFLLDSDICIYFSTPLNYFNVFKVQVSSSRKEG